MIFGSLFAPRLISSPQRVLPRVCLPRCGRPMQDPGGTASPSCYSAITSIGCFLRVSHRPDSLWPGPLAWLRRRGHCPTLLVVLWPAEIRRPPPVVESPHDCLQPEIRDRRKATTHLPNKTLLPTPGSATSRIVHRDGQSMRTVCLA